MLGTSEGANMSYRGEINILGKIFFIVYILFHISRCVAQDTAFYYICSYENPQWGTNALFSKINLDTKHILFSSSVSMPGQIMVRKPIAIVTRRDTLFFISAVNGEPAKNSEAENQTVTNYIIFNSQGTIINSGQLPDLYIVDLLSYAGDSAVVRFDSFEGGLERKIRGVLKIASNGRPNITPVEQIPNYSFPDSVNIFTGFQRIDKNDNDYFWCINEKGVYILSFNIPQKLLIDSLNIDHGFSYSHLFALSTADSSVYVFSINYNIMDGPESLRKVFVDPSYLNRYGMNNFSLIDSIPIAYPQPDSGYVMAEYGSCEKVGPYLVYYFFTGEDYRYFSPAMLFIFDTRTNQATWLRVGWR